METKNVLVIILTAIMVTVLWQILEISIYGTVIPNAADSIIAGLLTASLYSNYYIAKRIKQKDKMDYDFQKKYCEKLERYNEKLELKLMRERAFLKAYEEAFKK